MTTTTKTETRHGSVPHGGTLINRAVEGSEAERLASESADLFTIELTPRELSDVEMIVTGGFSPLEGFMGEADYRSVVERMRLANGLPWTIPITLSLDADEAARIRTGDRVALRYGGRAFAVMDVEEIYTRDRRNEARQVFRTDDEAHPGVAALYAESDTVIGGPVTLFAPLPDLPFPEYRLRPAETRRVFAERGWRTIVGFQTRNPVHRSHEYMQKCALETVDGLLLHPLVGETKADDIPADIRMRAYEILLDNYYPADRVVLSVNPAAMRYGGPREAVFHALIRKNFGCTHFIVGRDHAGVGNYYGPYDAQHIFSEFTPDELGIQPLFFENAFFCNVCGTMATDKTCPHAPEDHVSVSGTKVRELLRAGELLPPTFTRPEVAEMLAKAMHDE